MNYPSKEQALVIGRNLWPENAQLWLRVVDTNIAAQRKRVFFEKRKDKSCHLYFCAWVAWSRKYRVDIGHEPFSLELIVAY